MAATGSGSLQATYIQGSTGSGSLQKRANGGRVFFRGGNWEGRPPDYMSCSLLCDAPPLVALTPGPGGCEQLESLICQLGDPWAIVPLDDLRETLVARLAAAQADGVPPVPTVLGEVRNGSREDRTF